METLLDILADIKLEFGKSKPDLEARLEAKITQRLRELCSDFDYWFLNVEPGVVVGDAFPYVDEDGVVEAPTDFGLGRWLDQGFLFLQEGVSTYQLAVPYGAAISSDSRSWAYCQASRINYAKTYDLKGNMQADLEVVNSNLFWGRNSGPTQGQPHQVLLQQDTEGNSYVRVHPTPKASDTILCISFQLAVPPWFPVTVSMVVTKYNWISQYYHRVLHCIAGLIYSMHYKETQLYTMYMRELMGDTDSGVSRSDIPNTGLVGKMKRDTIKRHTQEDEELPYFGSKAESVSRDGHYRRRPGDSYYVGEATY